MSKKGDRYLNKFINYCKKRFEGNLMAIVIYGSYAFGYFNKKESDYDIFVIFKDKIPKMKGEMRKIQREFKKISLQYFCTEKDLVTKIKEGHWSIYITLLKSARALYKTRGYNKFLKKIRRIDFLEEVLDITGMEIKIRYESNILKKSKGYKAAKWALPSIRKRLQLLTYIRYKKIIWNFKKVLLMNKDLMDNEEINFLIDLEKKVEQRSKVFNEEDKKIALKILYKLDKELIIKELPSKD